MRLQTKLLLAVVPLIVAPLVALGTLAYVQLRADSEQFLIRELEIVPARIEQIVKREIATARANAELFSGLNLVEKYVLTEDPLERYSLLLPALPEELELIRRGYPTYKEIRLLTPNGMEDARSADTALANASDDESDAAYMPALRASKGKSVTSFYFNPDDGSVSLHVGVPLYLRDQAKEPLLADVPLRGFLAITVDLSKLENLVRETIIGKSGRLVFASSDGTILFHHDPAQVGTYLEPHFLRAIGSAKQTDEAVAYEPEGGGAQMLMHVREVTPNLQMIALLPQEDLISASRTMGMAALAVVSVTIIVTSILILLVLKRLVLTPVSRLRKAAHAMGAGELLTPVNVKTEDELAELGKTLEDMGTNLHRTQEDLLLKARALEAATDKAKAASEAKSQFLAHMSHEIRTPIYGVLGMAEVLSYTGLDDKQKGSVESIMRSGRILKAIISDVLDFSRIEAGKLDLQEEEFDLPLLVSDLKGLFSERARKKGLKLEWELPSRPLPMMIGDRGRIGQILINLIGNAIKFTSQGSVSFSVEVEETAGDRVSLCFDVRDTGPGLGRETQETIFNAFTQAESGSTLNRGGAGLGLAISKELAELMDGDLGVTSAPGKGSVFRFTVALRRTDTETVPAQSADAADLKESQERTNELTGTVLLAEDNPVNQAVTNAMLENLGFRVEIVGTGRSAVDSVSKRDFDALLLDCDMPDIDGFEAAQIIRAREQSNGHAARLPIIAQTANAFKDDRDRCLAAGMDDFISKPFTQDDLHRVLSRWLRTATGQTDHVTAASAAPYGGAGSD